MNTTTGDPYVTNIKLIMTFLLITLATISTGNLVFDAPACIQRRFENFLRGGAVHDAVYCVKGQKKLSPAIFKTFSKNPGIGTRTHAGEEWSQRGSNPRGEARTLPTTPG